ncbi:DUF1311 domain-containing protein [Pseudoduganella plicata]|nr:DUF1311 domain-containing protein [Pseudoduganella plicata]
MICAQPALSALDGELAKAYEAARRSGRHPGLLAQQRAWLADVRDRCTDAACLRAAYTTRIAALRGGERPCEVSEAQLIGAWRGIDGTDPEEFELSHERTKRVFTSWRNHRLDMMGVWTYQGCRLHIAHISQPALGYDFHAVSRKDGKLTLRDGGGATYVYTAAKP